MNDWNNDSRLSVPTSVALRNRRALRRSRRLFWGTIIFLVFVMGVSVGFGWGSRLQVANLSYDDAVTLLHKGDNRNLSPTLDFKLFWNVWEAIEKRYVAQPVDGRKLFYSAIQGLVAGTDDPYSVFFPPDASKDFMDEINGNFEGIGAEIGVRNNQLTIIAPLAGSPAERAGLLAGDVLLGIDDVDAQSLTLNDAVQKIRGPEGTTVKLLLQREGTPELVELTIERKTIHIESVRYEEINASDQRIAFITITNFNSDTAKKFQEVVNVVILNKPDGIILDLRNNPGGFLDVAVNIASSFVPQGAVVVIEQSKDNVEKPYTASGAAALQQFPTIVLVNRGSASASEILAGALQDHGKATIVGTTTFGKGTVQDLQSFDDGSSLKLTVARWLTPNRHLIDNVGITPDTVVDRSVDDIEAGRDPQKDAAVLFFTDVSAFQALSSNSNAAVLAPTN